MDDMNSVNPNDIEKHGSLEGCKLQLLFMVPEPLMV